MPPQWVVGTILQTLKEVIWDFCEKLFHFCLQNGQSLKDNFHNHISRLTNETLCDTPPNESSLPDKARPIKIIRNKGGWYGESGILINIPYHCSKTPKERGIASWNALLTKALPNARWCSAPYRAPQKLKGKSWWKGEELWNPGLYHFCVLVLCW